MFSVISDSGAVSPILLDLFGQIAGNVIRDIQLRSEDKSYLNIRETIVSCAAFLLGAPVENGLVYEICSENTAGLRNFAEMFDINEMLEELAVQIIILAAKEKYNVNSQ